MEPSEIRQEARAMMQGLWGTCVPIWLIYIIVCGASGLIFGKLPVVNFVISLVIGGPFVFGITKIFLRIYHHEQIDIGQLFEGFSEFTRAFTAFALVTLYVVIGMILLIVPGIMLALAYSMTFFIMVENPAMPATEAMRQSKQMMLGHKWELFWLGLSFIGWLIISILTFGIGLLWLESYIMSAYVIFYHKLKGTAEEITIKHEEPAIQETDNLN